MRPELVASACPNSTAATMLITRPTNVSTFGEMRVSANPCTMRSRSQPQPRPKALVQVIPVISLILYAGGGVVFLVSFGGFIVNRRQFQNLKLALPVGSHNVGH